MKRPSNPSTGSVLMRRSGLAAEADGGVIRSDVDRLRAALSLQPIPFHV
jgi:hypothetical protein